MCGVLGGRLTGDIDFIEKNLAFLKRRGPDSQGILKLDNGLMFGATRLAMTDPLPRSNQPMCDSQTGDVLVFNGEIFNFKKIRKDLLDLGISFDTESDTEVLLKSLSIHGERIIPFLEGMFAFAFYSSKNNSLILSRDFLGKKPLYYYLNGSNFLFSSQTKLLRKILNTNNIDYDSLYTYLTLGYIIDPSTMYSEIKSVQPGEVLIIDIKNFSIIHQEKFIPSAILNPYDSDFRSDFSSSLLSRVEGHNKFALSLSGGLDSSIIALQCAEMNLPVTAYTLRWADLEKEKYDLDAYAAEKIAKKIGIDINVITMASHEHIPRLLTEYVNAMEEPNANPTGVSMMELYSAIRLDGNRLVLTGDGADEVIGGYPRYRYADMQRYFPEFKSKFLERILNANVCKNRKLQQFAASLIHRQSEQYWLYWHRIADQKYIHSLTPIIGNSGIELGGLELGKYFHDNRVSSLMFRDLRTWLCMESNRKLDRISMWNSMEARSPFQSEVLIGNSYRKMSGNSYRLNQKEIMKEAFVSLERLPTRNAKAGFISPLGNWLRNNTDLINDTIHNLPSFIPINTKELKKLSLAPFNRDFENTKRLWSLIVLNCWFINQ
jgi:asparagine synthase (glutamine-hydrolysing)